MFPREVGRYQRIPHDWVTLDPGWEGNDGVSSTWARVNRACVQQCCTATVILYVTRPGEILQQPGTVPRGRQDADSAAVIPLIPRFPDDGRQTNPGCVNAFDLVGFRHGERLAATPVLVRCFRFSKFFPAVLYRYPSRRFCLERLHLRFSYLRLFNAPGKTMKVTRKWWLFGVGG